MRPTLSTTTAAALAAIAMTLPAAPTGTAATDVPTATATGIPPDVAALMDPSVDPCDDFYLHACGGWLRNFTLPPDRPIYTHSVNGLVSRNGAALEAILGANLPHLGELWDSCRDVEALTALGNGPLRPMLGRLTQARSPKELLGLAAEFGALGPKLFAPLSVQIDAQNATGYALHVGVGELIVPAPYYRDPGAFASIEGPYRTYIKRILTLGGVDETGGPDANTTTTTTPEGSVPIPDSATIILLALERALADMLPPPETLTDPTASYHPMTYGEAAAAFPLALAAGVEALGLSQKAGLRPETKVIVASPTYLTRLEQLLQNTDLPSLRLYISFRVAHHYAPYLGRPFLEAVFAMFSTALDGITEPPPRAQTCTEAVMSLLPDLMGQHFAARMFDRQREAQVRELVQVIERTMAERLAGLPWLDAATRQAAQAKLTKVANLIGSPANVPSYSFKLSRTNYVANAMAIQTFNFEQALGRLGRAVDRGAWELSAAEVNAYYSPTENKMVFPAAILQPTFYSGLDAHQARNFGAIGAVIGHELTHSFDTMGRKYDGDGNFRDWWSPTTAAEFESRANCLRAQYNEFVVLGENGSPLGHVNGNLTCGENIADNGGVGLAFDAYRAWRQSTTPSASSPSGPTGADREAERLFFLSYGQIWCSKVTDGFAKQLLAGDVHAPRRFRVNGVVMNSGAFAETFQCKPKAPMNPENKCRLW